MDSKLKDLDLIDLLSERHVQLRGKIEKLWNEASDIAISNSEWFIMSRIYKKKTTISYVTKHVDLTRQAIHKLVKKLEAKGLIEISNHESNKKDKCIELTKLGEECYEKNKRIKTNLEKEIEENIGPENMNLLKKLLKSDWGFESIR